MARLPWRGFAAILGGFLLQFTMVRIFLEIVEYVMKLLHFFSIHNKVVHEPMPLYLDINYGQKKDF